MSDSEKTQLTEIELLPVEEYISKVVKDLCYDVANYSYSLIREIFANENKILKTIDTTTPEGKKENSQMYLFNNYLRYYTYIGSNESSFQLVDLSEISNEKKILLEQRIIKKMGFVTKTYHSELDEALMVIFDFFKDFR